MQSWLKSQKRWSVGVVLSIVWMVILIATPVGQASAHAATQSSRPRDPQPIYCLSQTLNFAPTGPDTSRYALTSGKITNGCGQAVSGTLYLQFQETCTFGNGSFSKAIGYSLGNGASTSYSYGIKGECEQCSSDTFLVTAVASMFFTAVAQTFGKLTDGTHVISRSVSKELTLENNPGLVGGPCGA